jgi:hypothetical protein
LSATLWMTWSSAVLAAKATILVFNATVLITRGIMFLLNNATIAWSFTLKLVTLTVNAAKLAFVGLGVGMLFVHSAVKIMIAVMTGGYLATVGAIALANKMLMASFVLLQGFYIGFAASYTAVSAIFTGTSLVLSAPTIAASAVTFGLVAAALGACYIAAVALARSAYELGGLLPKIGTVAQEPIEYVTNLFAQWRDIILEIISLATTDMTAAWQVSKSAFVLMSNQVKDAFPPLWKFIREGFK